jgi:hypothetical protein
MRRADSIVRGLHRCGVGLLWAAVFALCASAPAAGQSADRNAEARVFFEQGNEHFERAMDASGQRKRDLLQKALQDYVSSLRIVRSRNAVFNAAITLEKLERYGDAFSYYTEYLRIPGLSEDERAQARKRRDALRKHIAVVSVQSEPKGARVRVDRLDLAPRGETPLEIAVSPGAHTIYLTREGYERAEVEVTAKKGQTVQARGTLQPKPVQLHVRAPEGGRLLIDGEPASVGSAIQLKPGNHTVRYEHELIDPVERTVELEPGTGSRTLSLDLPQLRSRGMLVVQSNVPARVQLDGDLAGRGRQVRLAAQAGSHEVRVEAPGRVPYEGRVGVDAGSTKQLRVLLRPSSQERTLGRAPMWTGIGAGVVGAAALAISVRAVLLQNGPPAGCPMGECNSSEALREAEQWRDEVERWNLAADVTIGATAALGATTLVLALLNDDVEQDPSTATVAASPLKGGGVVRARLPFGGL